MKPAELTGEEQTAILAERYSQRAEAYDRFWSPVIRPAGERLIGQLPIQAASSIIDVGTGAGALLPAIRRAAPSATILGVDRSDGMLRLAREKHPGWLAVLPEGFITKDPRFASSKVFRVEDGVHYDHSGKYAAVGSFEYTGQ
jgi:SAM-dependent methyltransferase